MKLLGLCGPANVGKSTTARAIVRAYGAKGIKAASLAWAEPLYDAAEVLTGIPKEQLRSQDFKNKPMGMFADVPCGLNTLTSRQFLEWLGTDIFRNKVSPSFWIDLGLVRARKTGAAVVIFEDCRFDNEYEGVDHLIELSRAGIDYARNHASAMPPDAKYVDSRITLDGRTPEEIAIAIRASITQL